MEIGFIFEFAMDTTGVKIFKNAALEQDLFERVMELVDSKSTLWVQIFLKKNVSDPFRQQHVITSSRLAVALDDAIRPSLNQFNAAWTPRKWVVIWSSPGGERQQIHRDYLSSEMSDEEDPTRLPASAIIALDKPARLATYGYNRTRAMIEEEKIHMIPTNRLVIFRGDVIHCGMEYTEDNCRLHCYLDVPGTKYEPNVTDIVYFDYTRCGSCGKTFLDNRERTKHQKTCDDFTCRFCEGPDAAEGKFKTLGALKSHRKRKHAYMM